MSTLDTMFEASSVYFQHVNERAAHVKIDRVSICVDLGLSISNISSCQMAFDYWGFMNKNQMALEV